VGDIRFSVATPTLNALSKLKRCVGSLRGQEGASYEHLIQDALSTDGTPEWLAGEGDLLVRCERDQGMYDGINRAWARSRGEFLSWLNADEQYLPGTLQKVARFFDRHPSVDVVFGDYIVTDPAGWPVAQRREIPFRRLYVANGFLNAQSCTLFFRRRLYEEGLLFLDARYRYAADKALLLSLSRLGIVIARLREYLALFGIDGTNMSTHAAAESEAEAIRLANGAFRLRILRKCALGARRVERLLSGGYRRCRVRYSYALDAVPSYADFEVEGLGGRYTLSDTCGRLDARRTERRR